MKTPWTEVKDDMRKMLVASLEENGYYKPTMVTFDVEGQPTFIVALRPWEDEFEEKRSAFSEAFMLWSFGPENISMSLAIDTHYRILDEDPEETEDDIVPPSQDPQSKDALLLTLYHPDDGFEVWHYPYYRDDDGSVVFEDEMMSNLTDEGDMNSWMLEAIEKGQRLREQEGEAQAILEGAKRADDSIEDMADMAEALCTWLTELGHEVAAFRKEPA